MKQITIIGFLALILLSSCKDDSEVSLISIRNDTGLSFTVDFFPTSEASGYKLHHVFDSTYNNHVGIYNTPDENIDPRDLLSMAYDSLAIHISKDTVIYFGKKSDPDYLHNPFIDSEAWIFEQYTADFPTNRSTKTEIIHNHIFAIDLDKIIME